MAVAQSPNHLPQTDRILTGKTKFNKLCAKNRRTVLDNLKTKVPPANILLGVIQIHTSHDLEK